MIQDRHYHAIKFVTFDRHESTQDEIDTLVKFVSERNLPVSIHVERADSGLDVVDELRADGSAQQYETRPEFGCLLARDTGGKIVRPRPISDGRTHNGMPHERPIQGSSYIRDPFVQQLLASAAAAINRSRAILKSVDEIDGKYPIFRPRDSLAANGNAVGGLDKGERSSSPNGPGGEAI
jgi:hypothetical protein